MNARIPGVEEGGGGCSSQLTNTVQGVTAMMAIIHVRTGEDGPVNSGLLEKMGQMSTDCQMIRELLERMDAWQTWRKAVHQGGGEA